MLDHLQLSPMKAQNAKSKNLALLQKKFKEIHLNQLFAEDSARFQHFSVEYDQIVLDFSKHRINQSIINGLVELADE